MKIALLFYYFFTNYTVDASTPFRVTDDVKRNLYGICLTMTFFLLIYMLVVKCLCQKRHLGPSEEPERTVDGVVPAFQSEPPSYDVVECNDLPKYDELFACSCDDAAGSSTECLLPNVNMSK